MVTASNVTPEDSSSLLFSPDIHANNEWDEDRAADVKSLSSTTSRILSDSGQHTPYEILCFGRSLKLENAVNSSAGAAARTRSIKTSCSTIESSTTEVDGVLHGRATCRVCASAIETLAFLLDDGMKIKTKYDVGSATEQKTLEVVNDHVRGRYPIHTSYTRSTNIYDQRRDAIEENRCGVFPRSTLARNRKIVLVGSVTPVLGLDESTKHNKTSSRA
jgi:hypothetical protein